VPKQILKTNSSSNKSGIFFFNLQYQSIRSNERKRCVWFGVSYDDKNYFRRYGVEMTSLKYIIINNINTISSMVLNAGHCCWVVVYFAKWGINHIMMTINYKTWAIPTLGKIFFWNVTNSLIQFNRAICSLEQYIWLS
jgi:hypothetical protein